MLELLNDFLTNSQGPNAVMLAFPFVVAMTQLLKRYLPDNRRPHDSSVVVVLNIIVGVAYAMAQGWGINLLDPSEWAGIANPTGQGLLVAGGTLAAGNMAYRFLRANQITGFREAA